jgi:hypothetical protein
MCFEILDIGTLCCVVLCCVVLYCVVRLQVCSLSGEVKYLQYGTSQRSEMVIKRKKNFSGSS